MSLKVYINLLIKGIPQNVYVIALLTFYIGVVLLLGLYKWRRGWRYCLTLLLLEYVSLIFCSTVIFRRTLKARAYDYTPFWSYNKSELLVENMMNVAIFVPIGLLLGVVHRAMSWKKVLVIGMCLSVGIEVMQLVFRKGFSEVDDVMHNTLGCLIGYGIYRIIRYGCYQYRVHQKAYS